ncbi:MAG: class I SAM-dependent methyltransferase [Bacteroidota bacterium]
MTKKTIFSTGISFSDYYKSLNKSFLQIFKKHHMLHYPFFREHGESLEKRQQNLTDFCASNLSVAPHHTVLDVGCGNGVQSLYLADKLRPKKMMAIDINEDNVLLAQSINTNGVRFNVDNAEKLSSIENQSVDVLLCVESAFHYPDKASFLAQVNRVLKPNGVFLIADILSKSYKNRWIIGKWKRKMYYYHWTEEDYNREFRENGLVIDKQTNITSEVIKGYHGYEAWIKSSQCKNYLQFLIMRAFISIQVLLNVYLLKKRRHYMVFRGSKILV